MHRKHLSAGFFLSLAVTLLIAQGHVRSQGQNRPAPVTMLPLKQTAYIKASNAEAYDHFACGGANQGYNGNSIAVSGDGNTMAIGAPYESGGARGINGNQNDNSSYASGAVYVFIRQGDTWAHQAYLKASNTGQSDHFGASVAVSRDGHTMAVAAHWESSAATGINGDQNDDSLRQAGAVYIFTRTGNTCTQQAYIKASNTGRKGRPHDRLAGGSGALYAFTRRLGTWSQEAYIKGSKTEATDQLGYSVAISDDGNTIASGAGDEDCLTPGINPLGCDNDSPPRGTANIWVGATYVFVRTGTTWSEQAFIKASNPRPYNSFGVKLGLSGDGNTLAVATYVEDNGGQGIRIRGPELQPFLIVDFLDPWREHQEQAEESGAVYFYTRSGTTWTQLAYIKGSSTEAGDEFGSAVAVSGDGRTIVAGAHNEDGGARGLNGNQADNSGDDSGAAYVFTY